MSTPPSLKLQATEPSETKQACSCVMISSGSEQVIIADVIGPKARAGSSASVAAGMMTVYAGAGSTVEALGGSADTWSSRDLR